MSAPSNQQRIPSRQEVEQTKLSISALERELADATALLERTQQCIAALERDLEQNRAWIAPIRRLPFDILSEIFVICGTVERLAPVVIGEVCSQWRETVLATPTAWVHIYPQNYIENILPLEYVNMFLTGSSPCLIHIRIPWTRLHCYCRGRQILDRSKCDCPNVELILPHPHRIQCLTIEPTWLEEFFTVTFPNIIRLDIKKGIGVASIAPLDMTRFPCLHYLTISSPEANLSIDFLHIAQTQLQHLDLMVDRSGAWARLITLCATTLKSLRIKAHSDSFRPDKHIFDCPELERFSVRDTSGWGATGMLGFLVKAPILVSFEYLTDREIVDGDQCCYIKCISHLSTNCNVTLSRYPHLRILQLKHGAILQGVLGQLERDTNVCPKLERIELYPSGVSVDHTVHTARERLAGRNQRAGSNTPIELHSGDDVGEFHYRYNCSDDMPCRSSED